MTREELRKLDRHDLLELLVEQTREASRLRLVLEEREERLIEGAKSIERLKSKLDGKDEHIERLKGRLDGKDADIERLKGKLDAKDAELEAMRSDLERAEHRKRVLEDQNEALESEIAECRSGRLEELKASGFTDEMIKALGAILGQGRALDGRGE